MIFSRTGSRATCTASNCCKHVHAVVGLHHPRNAVHATGGRAQAQQHVGLQRARHLLHGAGCSLRAHSLGRSAVRHRVSSRRIGYPAGYRCAGRSARRLGHWLPLNNAGVLANALHRARSRSTTVRSTASSARQVRQAARCRSSWARSLPPRASSSTTSRGDGHPARDAAHRRRRALTTCAGGRPR